MTKEELIAHCQALTVKRREAEEEKERQQKIARELGYAVSTDCQTWAVNNSVYKKDDRFRSKNGQIYLITNISGRFNEDKIRIDYTLSTDVNTIANVYEEEEELQKKVETREYRVVTEEKPWRLPKTTILQKVEILSRDEKNSRMELLATLWTGVTLKLTLRTSDREGIFNRYLNDSDTIIKLVRYARRPEDGELRYSFGNRVKDHYMCEATIDLAFKTRDEVVDLLI